MARPEKPINPADGPAAEFAQQLRVHRLAAGQPSYRVMGLRAHYSAPALSKAASGQAMPAWACVRAYLRACGVSDTCELDHWKHRWQQARSAVKGHLSQPAGLPAAAAPLSLAAPADSDAPIRVMIGISSRLLRGALAAVIAAEPGIAVVGQALNLGEAAEMGAVLSPVVLVAELRTPMDLQGLFRFTSVCPDCAVVAVAEADVPTWLRARSHLFAGFLSDNAETIDLAASIRSAASHRQLAGPPAAEAWVMDGRHAEVVEVVEAAQAASSSYDFGEADHHWSRALQLTPAEAPERADVLQHAAETAHHSGKHLLALDLWAELADRPDAPSQCELHLRRARYLAAAGRSAPAEIEYELALNAPDGAPGLRATAAAHLAELLLYLRRYADANKRARQALDHGTVDGSPADVVRASAALGFSAAFREDPDAGLAVIRHAVELAERSGRPDDLGVAYLHLAELLTGPLNSVEEGILVARRGAERLALLGGARMYQIRLLAIAGNGLFRTGQWAEADAVLEDAMQSRPAGADAVELLLARCRVRLGIGDISAATRDLGAAATLLRDSSERHLPLLTLRAGLAIWQGDYAAARATIRRALIEVQFDDLVVLGVLTWHGLRAEAEARAAGEPVDPGALRRLKAVVSRISREMGTAAAPIRAVIDSYLDLCSGEIDRIEGRHDPEPWTRAAAGWDQRRHPYPAAYARLHRAEAGLHAESGKSAAVRALREAYATATVMGARPLAAQIMSVAQRFQVVLADDVDPVPPAPAEPDQGVDLLDVLTAREHEVLAAVAEGLTNREIGGRLFISERTVGIHVGHIFDKLQVRTRVQASRVYLTATQPKMSRRSSGRP